MAVNVAFQLEAPEAAPHEGLRPILDGELDEALPLLRRGFPEREPDFWQRGFERLGPRRRPGPLGYLLASRGEDLGVLLTFRSERRHPFGRRSDIVNLAGWYVDPEHRWKAPMMLRRIVGDPDMVFTDLTPSQPVERINAALGFAVCNEGRVITFLPPWAAIPSFSDSEVVGLDDPTAALVADRELLERHEAMGCVAAVLREGGRVYPLLFSVARRRGIRRANIIYAESRRVVLANRTAIARFLLARGIVVLMVDADRADCPRGSVFREGRRSYCKGSPDRDRIDYAFSELVLLHLDS